MSEKPSYHTDKPKSSKNTKKSKTIKDIRVFDGIKTDSIKSIGLDEVAKDYQVEQKKIEAPESLQIQESKLSFKSKVMIEKTKLKTLVQSKQKAKEGFSSLVDNLDSNAEGDLIETNLQTMYNFGRYNKIAIRKQIKSLKQDQKEQLAKHLKNEMKEDAGVIDENEKDTSRLVDMIKSTLSFKKGDMTEFNTFVLTQLQDTDGFQTSKVGKILGSLMSNVDKDIHDKNYSEIVKFLSKISFTNTGDTGKIAMGFVGASIIMTGGLASIILGVVGGHRSIRQQQSMKSMLTSGDKDLVDGINNEITSQLKDPTTKPGKKRRLEYLQNKLASVSE